MIVYTIQFTYYNPWINCIAIRLYNQFAKYLMVFKYVGTYNSVDMYGKILHINLVINILLATKNQ